MWSQEEPRNAGAYIFIADVFRTELKVELTYMGRDASATPAVGSKHADKKQQEAVLSASIGPKPKDSSKPSPEPKPAVAVPTKV